MNPALEVLATGALVLVEDDGRPGRAAVGVGRSGAADRTSHRLGARLVGHPEDRAALEVLLGGLVVRARGRVTVAVTGAAAPATLDGRVVAHAALVDVPDGATLSLGMPVTGVRTYLTVRGGIAVPPVLGSRSTDTLSGLGPARAAVVLDEHESAGREHLEGGGHVGGPASTNRTVVPGPSNAGGSRSTSHTTDSVLPSSCQPPGEERG